MSTVHLSELTLDRVASGLSHEPRAMAHLTTCEACASRLRQLEDEARQARQDPRMAMGLARLRSAAAPRAPRRARWPAFALAAALGVVAVAFSIWPQQAREPRSAASPIERTKGEAGIHLIDDKGAPAASTLTPGDVVALVVTGPKYARTLIFDVDRDGAVSALWPAASGASGPALPGVPLDPAFRVTPGRLTLVAFFGDETLRADDARRTLEAATRACVRADASIPDCPSPAPVVGERARATARYDVRDAN